MSHRLGRVVSDLSHGNHCKATTGHGLRALHHQSKSNNGSYSSDAPGKKSNTQKLSLLFAGVSAWRRSDSTGDTAGAKRNKQQAKGTGAKPRRLDISQLVWMYALMVEQLFTSSTDGGRKSDRPEQPRRTHTFASRRGSSNDTPSRRRKGRLSSAPASLRGSPASSGRHPFIGDSVKMSTSSELSTMEDLQSAVQAGIAHCKNRHDAK